MLWRKYRRLKTDKKTPINHHLIDSIYPNQFNPLIWIIYNLSGVIAVKINARGSSYTIIVRYPYNAINFQPNSQKIKIPIAVGSTSSDLCPPK